MLRSASCSLAYAWPVSRPRVRNASTRGSFDSARSCFGFPEAIAVLLQAPGGDWIETRGWLVEEEDVRVQRHRARQASPLGHAPADLRRVVVLEPRQTDQGQLERRQGGDLLG